MKDDESSTQSTIERLRRAAQRRREWAEERAAAESPSEGPVASARLRAVEVALESQRALGDRSAEALASAEQRASDALAEREEFRRGYQTQLEVANARARELDELSSELERATMECAAAVKERNALTQRIEFAEQARDEAVRANVDAEASWGETEREFAALKAEHETLRAASERLESQLSRLGEAHEAELSQALRKRETQIAELEHTIVSLERDNKEELAALGIELEQTRTNLAELLQDYDDLNASFEVARRDARELLDESERALGERTVERDELLAERADLRAELGLERERVESLRTDLQALQSAVEEQLQEEETAHEAELAMGARLTEAEGARDQARALATDLEASLEVVIRERDQLAEDSQVVIDALEAEQARSANLQDEFERLQAAMQETRSSGSATDAAQDGAGEVAQVHAEMEMARSIIQGLEDEATRADALVAQLRAELAKAQAAAANAANNPPVATRRARRSTPGAFPSAVRETGGGTGR